jgi:hypothetical protein
MQAALSTVHDWQECQVVKGRYAYYKFFQRVMIPSDFEHFQDRQKDVLPSQLVLA